MPRTLPQRWRPESIREFRASARVRCEDALALAAAGRRTGTIYLWGYSAEMLLKSAYFALCKKPETSPILPNPDLTDAIKRAKSVFAIVWLGPGPGHYLRGWSELLEAERSYLGVPYAAGFRRRVQMQVARIGELWSVSLRYHSNLAYAHEVAKVQAAAEWLLAHADEL